MLGRGDGGAATAPAVSSSVADGLATAFSVLPSYVATLEQMPGVPPAAIGLFTSSLDARPDLTQAEIVD